MFLKSLSGRLLILATAFVMLAEVLIFVPSVARFRESYLLVRLEKAQIASLALLADETLSMELEEELLANAGVFNVVLRRDEAKQLVLSSSIPSPVSGTFDLRDYGAFRRIGDALARLASPRNDVIRVIGSPVRNAGLLIEVAMETAPLRAAMIDYGTRILAISAGGNIGTSRGRIGSGRDADPCDRGAEAEGTAGPAWLRRREDQPRSAQHPVSGAAFFRQAPG